MLLPGADWQTLLTDPVCGRFVELDSPHRLVHDGALFAFCSAACRSQFTELPSRYAVIANARTDAAAATTAAGGRATTDAKPAATAGVAPRPGNDQTSAAALTQPPPQTSTTTTLSAPVARVAPTASFASPAAAPAAAHESTRWPALPTSDASRRPTWWMVWRERRFAARCAREMLRLLSHTTRQHPRLTGRELYRRLVCSRLHCAPADADALLEQAEHSFAIWPVTRALCYRDVVHYVAVSQFIAANPGARWVHADVRHLVERLVPADL